MSRPFVPIALALALAGAPARSDEGEDEAAAGKLLTRWEARRGVAAADTLELGGSFQITFGHSSMEKPAEGAFELVFSGNRVWEQVDYQQLGKMEVGNDGTTWWEAHPVGGTRVMSATEADSMRRLYGVIRGRPWRELYEKARLDGTRVLGGRPHAVVRMTPFRQPGEAPREEAKADTWLLDSETAQLDQLEMRMRGVDEKQEDVEIQLSGWKAVQGVLYAQQQRVTSGPVWAVYRYERIVPDAKVEERRFQLPERLRQLGDRSPGKKEESVEIQVRRAQAVLSIRTFVKPEEVTRALAKGLAEVMACLTEIGGRTDGPPFARYHGEKDGLIELETGIPVAERVAGKGRIAASTLPEGRVAMRWYSGPYTGRAEARAQLGEWIRSRGLTARGGPWEIFWTDPAREPDPARWRTQIVWPVE
jgi:effector-binding domain-containing protein